MRMYEEICHYLKITVGTGWLRNLVDARIRQRAGGGDGVLFEGDRDHFKIPNCVHSKVWGQSM